MQLYRCISAGLCDIMPEIIAIFENYHLVSHFAKNCSEYEKNRGLLHFSGISSFELEQCSSSAFETGEREMAVICRIVKYACSRSAATVNIMQELRLS